MLISNVPFVQCLEVVLDRQNFIRQKKLQLERISSIQRKTVIPIHTLKSEIVNSSLDKLFKKTDSVLIDKKYKKRKFLGFPLQQTVTKTKNKEENKNIANNSEESDNEKCTKREEQKTIDDALEELKRNQVYYSELEAAILV